jgi:hypothetical protein
VLGLSALVVGYILFVCIIARYAPQQA